MASINSGFLAHPIAQKMPENQAEWLDWVKVLVEYTSNPDAIDVAIEDSRVIEYPPSVPRAPEVAMEDLTDVDYGDTPPAFLETLNYNSLVGLWQPTNMAVMRACEVAANGNGTGDLTIRNSFNLGNVDTPVDGGGVPQIKRIDEGEYKLQLATTSLYGVNLLDHVVASIHVSPNEVDTGDIIAKWGSFKSADPVAGTVLFSTWKLTTNGAGSNVELERIPEDLHEDDYVSVMIHLTGDSATELVT